MTDACRHIEDHEQRLGTAESNMRELRMAINRISDRLRAACLSQDRQGMVRLYLDANHSTQTIRPSIKRTLSHILSSPVDSEHTATGLSWM